MVSSMTSISCRQMSPELAELYQILADNEVFLIN